MLFTSSVKQVPWQVNGEYANREYVVPMATHEGALLASYSRGAKAILLKLVVGRSASVRCFAEDVGYSRDDMATQILWECQCPDNVARQVQLIHGRVPVTVQVLIVFRRDSMNMQPVQGLPILVSVGSLTCFSRNHVLLSSKYTWGVRPSQREEE